MEASALRDLRRLLTEMRAVLTELQAERRVMSSTPTEGSRPTKRRRESAPEPTLEPEVRAVPFDG